MMRKLFAFALLFVAFSSICYAGSSSIKFYTIPADVVEQGQTLKIVGSVSAPANESCSIVVVIKHDTNLNKSGGWIGINTLINETLDAGVNKTYNLSWIVPQDAEAGDWGVYAKCVVNNKMSNHSYPQFNVIRKEVNIPHCEQNFVGEKYCESGALYQKYQQSNCSIIKKKIRICDFGCKNEKECNENISSNVKNISGTNISYNSTNNSNISNGISNKSENKTNFSEQQQIEQDNVLYEESETISKGYASENKGIVSFSAISGMFSKSSNLSLIGIIIILVIIGVILWKI